MENNLFLSQTNFDFKDKKVLVRFDCDVDLKDEDGKLVVDEDFRLKQALPTIRFLQEKGVEKIILLGHLGRPEGKVVEELRLVPVAEWFLTELSFRVNPPVGGEIEESLSLVQEKGIPRQARDDKVYKINDKVFLLENLRFNKREEENDEGFSRELAELGDVFINDAFGVSHREHASIVGIPKFLPGFLGLNFEKEITNLSKIKVGSERPLVFVLGGSKKDKLDYLEFLGEWCDSVLVGGKLPQEVKSQKAKGKSETQNSKLFLAELNTTGRDLSDADIEKFREIIKTSHTVVWAGPMGVYEEKENQKGTFEIAKAVSEVNGFKVAGGGDTHRIISWLNLWDKFDFVSSGGGAMLSFLKNGTLPGIECLKD